MGRRRSDRRDGLPRNRSGGSDVHLFGRRRLASTPQGHGGAVGIEQESPVTPASPQLLALALVSRLSPLNPQLSTLNRLLILEPIVHSLPRSEALRGRRARKMASPKKLGRRPLPDAISAYAKSEETS